MADAKITALTANTDPAADDLFVMVDDPAGTPITKKVALSDLAADATEMEAGTATGRFVTPEQFHRHPAAAKAWCKAGITGSIDASYNMTSVTDGGTGLITFTIATDFSSANYAYSINIENIDASIDASTDVQICFIGLAGQAAGTLAGVCGNASGTAAVDPTKWTMIAFGDQ